MRFRSLVLSALCVAPFVGCAGSNYYDTYTRENPGAYVTLPDAGTGLHETLAGLYLPRQDDYRLLNGRIAVLRITEDSAAELSREEIAAALDAPSGDTHYGIVSVVNCTSRIDMKTYSGQRVQWMLLERGKLSAWDLSPFATRCIVGSDFKPAVVESAALENQVRAFLDREFPRSMTHAAQLYAQGLIYLQAGRLEAAEESLARGDGNFDPDSPHVVRFEQPSDKLRTAGDEETAFARAELVRAIKALRNARAAGQF